MINKKFCNVLRSKGFALPSCSLNLKPCEQDAQAKLVHRLHTPFLLIFNISQMISNCYIINNDEIQAQAKKILDEIAFTP